MSEVTLIPGPENTRDYRDALGCFSTGVTVVTTRTPRGPLAMTANSFASVSLNPAMVLWCASKASLRHDAFASATDYIIHILADDQKELALHFAHTGEDFASLAWQENESGQPVLTGCLARFECEQAAHHDAGDHTIIVGHVKRAARRPGTGLVFKRGQYGRFSGLD